MTDVSEKGGVHVVVAVFGSFVGVYGAPSVGAEAQYFCKKCHQSLSENDRYCVRCESEDVSMFELPDATKGTCKKLLCKKCGEAMCPVENQCWYCGSEKIEMIEVTEIPARCEDWEWTTRMMG